jgi:hypothetical protein
VILSAKVVENADSSTISLMVPSKDGQVAGVGRAESTCLGKIWEKMEKTRGKTRWTVGLFLLMVEELILQT